MAAFDIFVGKVRSLGGNYLILSLALLLPSTSRSQVCGDINGSGTISIYDIVSIVRFLHDDGCITSGMQPVPCHESEGDVDGYCGITIGDALLLSEYIFEGGPPPTECSSCTSAALPISESDTIRITSTAVPSDPTIAEIVVSGVFHESPAGLATLGCSLPLQLRDDGAPATIVSIGDMSVNPPGVLHTVDVDDLTGNLRISVLDINAQAALAEFDLTITVSLPAAANRQLIEVDTAAAPPLNSPVIVRETDSYSPGLALYRPIFEGLSIAPCADADGDSVCDVDDNCPTVANPGQEDNNGNGTGDACEIVCGDADGSGQVDITDVVHLITYIFAGGQPPLDIAAGDYNCDARTNITDAVHMINYIFAAGPPPCAEC